MKINTPQQNPTKKIAIITAVVVLLLAGGYTAFAYTQNTWPFNDQDTSENTSSTKNSDSKKDSDINASTGSNDTENTPESSSESTDPKKTPPKYEGENPNTKPTLSGIVNYAAAQDGTLMIRTTINQTLSSGTCSLTLTQNDKKVTRTANIINNPSSSTCSGFDIPVSEVGSGTWKININLTSGDKTGNIIDKVNI